MRDVYRSPSQGYRTPNNDRSPDILNSKTFQLQLTQRGCDKGNRNETRTSAAEAYRLIPLPSVELRFAEIEDGVGNVIEVAIWDSVPVQIDCFGRSDLKNVV